MVKDLKNFKVGDKVVMHTCLEATHYRGKVWGCRTDSFIAKCGDEVVFLEGFSGYFMCSFLRSVTDHVLTLEQLSPYLPYDLQYEVFFEGERIIQTIDPYNVMNFINHPLHTGNIMLRPLSDLTQEIEHNGETFVPIEWLTGKFGEHVGEWAYLYTHSRADLDDMPLKAARKLYQWHFDLDGLLGKGLAIERKAKEVQEDPEQRTHGDNCRDPFTCCKVCHDKFIEWKKANGE